MSQLLDARWSYNFAIVIYIYNLILSYDSAVQTYLAFYDFIRYEVSWIWKMLSGHSTIYLAPIIFYTYNLLLS